VKYSFDTSAFVVPSRNWIPMDIVPGLWEMKDSLVQRGEIVASREVYLEISQIDNDLLQWIKERRQMFIDVDEEQQQYVTDIVNRFPTWVDTDAQRNIADPYVIALAKQHNLVVVSHEGIGNENNPKIPYVCSQFEVEHLQYTDFLREIGWRG
jgi:hypothetical protein